MTVVIDIACPSCGNPTSVRKEGLGTYRCTDCGTVFTTEDVEP